MDFGTVVFFFAIGLGAALLARNMTRWRSAGGGMEGLPMKNGSVRMDLMGGKARAGAEVGEEPVDSAGSSAATVSTMSSEPESPEEGDRVVPRRARARRKKR